MLALFAAACSPGEAATPTPLPPTTEAAVTTNPPTTSSTAALTTTTVVPTTSTPPPTATAGATTTSTTLYIPISDEAEVLIPEGLGPFPAVVLAHGGGWVAGDPSLMRALARRLTEEGFLTVNTPYTLSQAEPGFPKALDDLACAVRLAASHPQGNGSVAIVGHSAGAHLSAVVALTGDMYGAACPHPGTGVPDRLIGLAGPYDTDRLGLIMLPFFGGGPQVVPDAWLAGNPHNLVDRNPGLQTLLLQGDEDGIVDISFATAFEDALAGAGSEVLLEIVEGADHVDIRDPDVVADLIVTWLLR